MELEKAGKQEMLEMVREISDMVNVHFIRQKLAREWLRPSQVPPGVLKFSSGKLM